MLLFWHPKLVLLAVPKTGTTALETALLPYADTAILTPARKKHTTARRYHRQLAPFFTDSGKRPLETMALIREPVDWLSSWYRYRARPEIAGKPSSTAGMSFDAFVDGWLSQDDAEIASIGRPSRFISDEDGMVQVDHLFRYEDMPEAVRFLENRIGVDLELPKCNVSPQSRAELSPEMDKRLRREAQAEFDLWESLGD